MHYEKHNDIASGKLNLRITQLSTAPAYQAEVAINALAQHKLLQEFKLATRLGI